ncbi:MAG: DMT family transporter [Candidatus Heimdallarchaeota archaeon]
MASMVILAIFLGILSYSMLNIGMGLQKKGAAELPKIEGQSVGKNLKNFFTNKTWLIGFALVQAQWIILTLAIQFGSLSIVTPLMSVGMVALVIFSYFYLKEPISKVEIIGIAAIIVGIAILGATNPTEVENPPLANVITGLEKLQSIIFLVVLVIFSILFVLASVLRKFKNADILFGVAAGITDALGAIFINAIMSGASYTDTSLIASSVYIWQWWLFMALLIFFNALATIYLQVAYQRGKAIIVAPIFAVIAMISPVFGGIIIFGEWNYLFTEAKWWILAVKIIALAIVTIGVIVLSIYSAKNRKFEEAAKLAAEEAEEQTLEETSEVIPNEKDE